MIKSLIIVGNGFDLAHGLETSYKHFIDYLVDKNLKEKISHKCLIQIPKYITDVKRFYSAVKDKSIDVHGRKYTSLIMRELLEDMSLKNWCDIEEKYFYHLSSVNTREQNLYQNVKTLNHDFERIKNELEEYLKTQQAGDEVLSYKYFFNSLLNEDSLVVNFNYTDTVKQLYASSGSLFSSGDRSSRILHIHGELGNAHNPIVFGYAANTAEINNLLDKGDNEYLTNIKRHAYLLANNERKLREYLDKNAYIDVHILGHSCGLSDKLILEEILNHKNIQSIRIYYYENRKNFFNSCVNIHRIIRNEDNLKKIVNFEDSSRMPQKKDDDSQTEAFKSYLYKYGQENNTLLPPLIL